MKADDLPQFAKVLTTVMTGYGKAVTAPEIKTWFDLLAPFSPAVITQAFNAYTIERPDFAPVPNGIIARCRLLDGRPTDDEAWAIALSSQDERETVVWTEEASAAFTLCKPVLAGGDEVGARMAFKDAYNRLVSAARAASKPPVWIVSEGWDKFRKLEVVEKAVRAGYLLPTPEINTLMIAHSNASSAYPEGLRRLKEEMAKLEDPNEKAERIRLQRLEAEQQATQERKQEIDGQVKQYQTGQKAA